MSKTSSPFFSLILPNYKTEPFLEQCLKSILNQTFTNFECILLNDGSPGVTIPLNQIEKQGNSSDYWYRKDFQNQYISKDEKNQALYIFKKVVGKDYRFKYFEHTNIGQGPTRNRGISLATGKRIVFVDCDDFLEASYLEKVYYKIVENENQIYYADIFTYENEKINKLKKFVKNFPTNNNLKTLLVYPSLSLNTINYFWKTDFIKKNGIKYIGGKGEDTKFLLECLLAYYLEKKYVNDFQLISNSGYYYRLFPYQNFREKGFESSLFMEITEHLETKLSELKKLGLIYYILGRLFIIRFRLYNLREKSESWKKIVINLYVKILSLLAIFLAGYKKF